MPIVFRSPSHARGAGFTEREFAFALAWELYVPGLGGWTIQRDTDEDEGEFILVDPPLVYGDGFILRKDAEGVRISSPLGLHRAASLRDALLLICPLAPDMLDAADQMAELPTVDHMLPGC